MSFESGVRAGLSILASKRAKKQQDLANHIRGYDQNSEGKYVPNAYGKQVESTNMSVAQAKQQQSIALNKQAQVDQTGADAQLAVMQQQMKRLQDTINTSTLTTAVTQITQGKHKDAQTTINNVPSLKESLATEMDVHEVAPIDWANDGAIVQSMLRAEGLTLTPEQLKDPEVYESMNKSFVKVRDGKGNWKVVSTAGIAHETGVMNFVDDTTRTNIANSYNKIMDVWAKKHISTPREEAMRDKDMSIMEGYQQKGITTAGATEIEKQNAAAAAKAANPVPEKNRPTTPKQKHDFELQQKAEEISITKAYEFVQGKVDKGEPLSPDEEEILKHKVVNKLSAGETSKLTGYVATELQLGNLATAVEKDPSLWKPINSLMNTYKKFELAAKQAIGGDKEAKATADAIREQMIKETAGISTNSEIQTMVAMFVNAVSGQAVTDNEFTRHLGNLTGGSTISSAEGLIAAMRGSARGLKGMSDAKIKVFFAQDPLTVSRIMGLRGKKKEEAPKKEAIFTPSTSNTPLPANAPTPDDIGGIDLSQFEGGI